MNDTTKTNMTVEDRLAEKLKGAEFAQWFGEDDLRELVEKALTKAFFTDRIERNGSYHTIQRPPVIIEVATEQIKTQMDALVLKAIAEELAKDPGKLDRLVEKALADGIDALVLRALARGIAGALMSTEMDAVNRVGEAIRSGLFQLPPGAR